MPDFVNSAVLSGDYFVTPDLAGRKIVQASNGDLYAVVAIDGGASFGGLYLLYLKNGETVWQRRTIPLGVRATQFAIAINPVSDDVYVTWCENNLEVKVQVYNNFNLLSSSTPKSGTYTITALDIGVSDDGQEVGIAMTGRLDTSKGYGMRYYRTVTGGATWEYVNVFTNPEANSSSALMRPSIQFDGNMPIIATVSRQIAQFNSSTSRVLLLKRGTGWSTASDTHIDWTFSGSIGNNQNIESMSFIVVPASVSGLGRSQLIFTFIGVINGYYGTSTQSSVDGGMTWQEKGGGFPGGQGINFDGVTTTCNKNGYYFVIVTKNSNLETRPMQLSSGVWNNIDSTTTNVSGSPSSVYRKNTNFSRPLKIYRNLAGSTSIRFDGEWSVDGISVPPGNLGIKNTKEEFLSYNINSEKMATVYEKINGVTVGTKTLTSGQSTTINLTQQQWDDIIYGKYRNYQENINLMYQNPINWENGFYTGNVNVAVIKSASNSYIRLKQPMTLGGNLRYTYKVSPGYKIQIIETNNSDVVTTFTNWTTNEAAAVSKSSTTRFYANIRRVDETDIPNSEVANALPVLYVLSEPPKNTLTIEMGSNVWKYTFDKRPHADDDLLSATKAVKDTNEVYYKAIKQLLINKVGGSQGDNFENLINRIGALSDGKKMYAIGTVTSGVSTQNFNLLNGIGSVPLYTVIVTGLAFKPSVIILKSKNLDNVHQTTYQSSGNNDFSIDNVKVATFNNAGFNNTNYNLDGKKTPISVSGTGFTLPTTKGNEQIFWEAWE